MRTGICLLALATSLIVLPSCTKEKTADVAPVRETIEIKYAAAEVEVKAHPKTDAETIATFKVGESVSLVGGNEEWEEIKLGFEKFGWVPKTDLAATREEISSTEDNIRFRIPPEPVTSPGVRGQIVIEASVNAYGDVIGVRVKQNTTRRPDIEQLTLASIKHAKFYPLMSEGKAKPFLYTYTASF
jgi:SH3-like domain-containing protein